MPRNTKHGSNNSGKPKQQTDYQHITAHNPPFPPKSGSLNPNRSLGIVQILPRHILHQPTYTELAYKEGSIYLFSCRVPVGTHPVVTYNHRTAPSACTVLFISHPFGVIYRSLHKYDFCFCPYMACFALPRRCHGTIFVIPFQSDS